MIVPSSPQEAPCSGPAVSHRETTPPPCRGIFFNFLPAKNPIHWPSGEKKGSTAPSVPASIVTVDCSRRRIASCRSEEHTSELQSLRHLVCRLLLEKKHTR